MSAVADVSVLQQKFMVAVDRGMGAESPSASALRELFVDLWTRCSEASFRASILASNPSINADANASKTLRNIEDFCDVSAIYQRMHALLNRVQADEDREIDRLRTRVNELTAANSTLRRKLNASEYA